MKLEWLIIELIVLGLAVFELASLYRYDRRAKRLTKSSAPRAGHPEGQQRADPAGGKPVE